MTRVSGCGAAINLAKFLGCGTGVRSLTAGRLLLNRGGTRGVLEIRQPALSNSVGLAGSPLVLGSGLDPQDGV